MGTLGDPTGAVPVTLELLLGCRSKENHELEFMLQVLDSIFGENEEIPWKGFMFSGAYHCLLSHILPGRAWNTIRARDGLAHGVSGIV